MAAFLGLVVMFWSYLVGPFGPWIAIAGIAAAGVSFHAAAGVTHFLTRRKVAAATVIYDRTKELQAIIDALESELKTTDSKIEKAAREAADARESKLQKDTDRLWAIAKVSEMKQQLREQIEASQRACNYETVKAWMAGTNKLLQEMRLANLPCPVHDGHHQSAIWHQENIAHLRGLILKIGEQEAYRCR